MGTTPRGFRYPPYTNSPDIPGDFYNLATDVNTQFDNYDTYVGQQVANEASARTAADNAVISDYNTKINTANSARQSGDDALTSRINNLVIEGSWNPGIGGSGASIGNNSGSEGSYRRIGGECVFRGRVIFGSGASFGSGDATISGIPISMYAPTATGTGIFMGNGVEVLLTFRAYDGAQMLIRRQKNDGNLGYGYDLGTPPQSSVMLFTFTAKAA